MKIADDSGGRGAASSKRNGVIESGSRLPLCRGLSACRMPFAIGPIPLWPAILERLTAAKTGEFVFPGQRQDKPLSGMAMEMVLHQMKAESVTVHGFCSAFRDWCGEAT